MIAAFLGVSAAAVVALKPSATAENAEVAASATSAITLPVETSSLAPAEADVAVFALKGFDRPVTLFSA